MDFHQGEDRIDLSAINSFSLRFIAIGDFSFEFIGQDAFSGERPEARYDLVGHRTVVQLDGVSIRVVSLPEPMGGGPAVIEVPTDGVADAEIVLAGRIDLQETDFLLHRGRNSDHPAGDRGVLERTVRKARVRRRRRLRAGAPLHSDTDGYEVFSRAVRNRSDPTGCERGATASGICCGSEAPTLYRIQRPTPGPGGMPYERGTP